jgi:hypothetical protein
VWTYVGVGVTWPRRAELGRRHARARVAGCTTIWDASAVGGRIGGAEILIC